MRPIVADAIRNALTVVSVRAADVPKALQDGPIAGIRSSIPSLMTSIVAHATRPVKRVTGVRMASAKAATGSTLPAMENGLTRITMTITAEHAGSNATRATHVTMDRVKKIQRAIAIT